jgi:hypothetical protein
VIIPCKDGYIVTHEESGTIIEWGYCEGEPCNRKSCYGVIEENPVENCSCHLNPPCSACTAPRGYCPVCGWEESEE